MLRPIVLVLSFATISAAAQYPAGQYPAGQYPAAPIQRNYGGAAQSNVRRSEVIPGVLLRSASGTVVETVSANSDRVELRVTRGVINVSVREPAGHTEILVDLPGGQTAILEDGLYTFNAASSTVRVYKGKAEAFAADSDRSVKLDESHFTTFAGGELRAIEGNHTTARADVLPGVYADGGGNRGDGAYRRSGPYGDGYASAYYPGYAYSPYGGYGYGYPHPYGYYGGYPYGYGVGIGLGFGYYGGYGRGYYGGGFRRR